MQLCVVVDLVHPAGKVFAIIMREIHLSPLVVEGAEVHDARRSRVFQQIWNGRKTRETLTAEETTKTRHPG